jgi:23S rRNA (guanosine2251-2'-O)-methyltransferase
VDTVDTLAIEKMARGGVHQGIAADVQALPAYSLEELVRGSEGPPLLVVLDSIEDPQNVGAHRPDRGCGRRERHHPPGAPRGAARRRDRPCVGGRRESCAHGDGREHRPRARRTQGALVWTVGLDAGAGDAYDSVDYTIPTAFVLGAESTGLRRLVRERCDRLVSIPMAGAVRSLNVSVRGGVALFEAARQRRATI